MELTIAYWNTAGRNGLASLILDSDQEYDIVAIQEPWYNKQTQSIYGPARGRYYRLYDSGRAALYIHKRHQQNTWTTEAGPDWCKVRFGTGQDAITV